MGWLHISGLERDGSIDQVLKGWLHISGLEKMVAYIRL
jgi:hypothetical protein